MLAFFDKKPSLSAHFDKSISIWDRTSILHEVILDAAALKVVKE